MPDVQEVFRMSTQKVRQDPGALDRQLSRQRRAARNRRLGGFAVAAAILIVAVGAALVLSRGGGDRTAVTEAPTPQADGLPLTMERLEGIWYEDAGLGTWPNPLMARFGSDGTFALGEVAQGTAWLEGTYEIEERAIRFTVTEGECGSTDVFVWGSSIAREGRLEASHQGSSGPAPDFLGECNVPVGEPYRFTRVSPIVPGTEPEASRYVAPDGPLAAETTPIDLQGYWLIAGTGQLLRLDWSGSYLFDGTGDLATDPFDAGTFEVHGRTLRFLTGGGAKACAEGDVMVWKGVRVEGGALRAVVDRDSCGRDIGTDVRVLFLVNDPG